MFYGREDELQLLSEVFQKPKGSLVVVYGRRRIGKSTLIKYFAKDKQSLFFEGLERQPTSAQINRFVESLKTQLKDQQLLQKADFETWS